jgi:DNA-binding Lrp family transcriptional regulator
MESALVLITINSSKDKEVLLKLKELDEVTEAHLFYGPYDAYAIVEAESSQQLQDVVINNIRNIDEIKSTTTCFIAG